jgi:DNA-directed RNA polymerase specialized sigma24 family protein
MSELFDRYQSRLIGYFRKRGLEPATATEKADDTLFEVLSSRDPEAPHRFDPDRGAFASWLFTMAKYQYLHALDDVERERRAGLLEEEAAPGQPLKETVSDPHPSGDEEFWAEVERRAVEGSLQACLCQIEDERQRAAVQRWLETEGAHKLRELAAELGISTAGAGRARQAAFLAMRDCLVAAGVGEPE